MLLVVIALAVASILALSFLRAGGPTMAVASNIDKQAKARAVAEAGLELAIQYVNEDDAWRSDKPSGLWLADQPLNGGTFSVYGTDDDGDLADDAGDDVTLSVVAAVDGVTHRVWARVTPATGATTNLLLVVGDGGAPSDADLEKRDLFESWGYAVTMLDDSASQSEYDAALAGHDVVYISEEVNSGSVGTKLDTTVLGVVNEEPYLHDDFRVSEGGATQDTDATSIDIADNSHYITSIFTLGTLEVYLATDRVRSNSYAQPAGTEVLADAPGGSTQPTLMAAEVGAALTAGTAPGRRVMFPAGDDFRVTNLTEDGQLLLRRSIEWAVAGAPPSGDEPVLLAHYTFDQVMIDPSIIAHWQLEETDQSGGGLAVGGLVSLADQAVVDGYDARLGVYGGSNIGDHAAVATNSNAADRITLAGMSVIRGDAYVGTGADLNSAYAVASTAQITGQRNKLTSTAALPGMSPPLGSESSLGDIAVSTGTYTVNDDGRVNNLTLNGNGVFHVSGDVTFRVDGSLTIADTATIQVASGSSLTLWVGGNLSMEGDAILNTSTSATERVTVYLFGSSSDLSMTDDAQAVGTFYMRDDLLLSQRAALFGSVQVGGDAVLTGDSQVHLDKSLPALIDEETPVRDIERANHGGFRGDPAGGQPGATPLAGSGFSMYFDGSGDYIEMPHISAYELDGGTFSCWFKADTTSGRQGLFSKDSTDYDTGGHFSVFIENGKVRVRMQSTTASYWVESGTVSTHTWYHIMFAWGAEGMVLYLDGVAVDTNSYTGGLSSTSGGTGNFEPIVLGGNAWQSNNLVATPVKDYFHGFIDDLRIYDERLSAQQAIDLFNGIEPAGQLSPSLVEDTSGFGDPLNLAVEDPEDVTWSDGALTFDAATVAQSLGDASKLRDAILATGEFTVVARVQRAAPGGAAGPARIVSMSSSTGSRNFTVGQEGAAVEARVRTSTTGSNGVLSPDYTTGAVLNDDGSVHIAVTYDGETLRTYIDGTLAASQALAGVMSSWDATMPLLIGNELGGARPWLGTIDELSIYDRAITMGQAGSLATGGGLGVTDAVVTWDEAE